MSNRLLPKGKEALLSGLINLTADTIKVALVKSSYSASDSETYLSDIGSANIMSTSPALTSITVTGGVFKAANTTLPSVPVGTGGFLYLFKDGGSLSASRLISVDDTGDPLPITRSSVGDVGIQWDSAGIFDL
jgi:hypothetical protein